MKLKLIVSLMLFMGWECCLLAQSTLSFAITEVMAGPYWHGGGNFLGADFVELTYCGSEAATWNPTALKYSDNRRTAAVYQIKATNCWVVVNGVVVEAPSATWALQPGESIILVRRKDSIQTPADFMAWWWGTNLTQWPDSKICLYEAPGLDEAKGDEFWLYDEQTNVLDWVRFGCSLEGHTWTFDEHGRFGIFSLEGVAGARRAVANTNDIGSPGTVVGLMPLPPRFLQSPPSDLALAAGMSTNITIEVGGRPTPRVTWLHNGAIIPEASGFNLAFGPLLPEQAGQYEIVLDNGISRTNTVFSLSVSVYPAKPKLLPVSDVIAFPGQTAIFKASLAEGFPIPQCQWYSNNIPLPDATNLVLVLPGVALEMSGAIFSAKVWNSQGTNVGSAGLSVMPRPRIAFTEVMPRILPNIQYFKNWVEAVNFGTTPFNLKGCRLLDSVTVHIDALGFYSEAMFTITNDLVLAPGESVIFVDTMSAADFDAWWGANRLRPNQKICTFNGFSLGANEFIYIWNAASLEPVDCIAMASWGEAVDGVSIQLGNLCDATGCAGFAEADSVVGVDGVFKAALSDDIGSPGITSNSPPTIAELSASVAVPWGMDAELQVAVQSLQPNEIQWLNASARPIPDATGDVLSLFNVQSDATYYVQIMFGESLIISDPVKVKVVAAVITNQPCSLGVADAKPATLSVGASGVNLSYQWYRNGEEISGATSAILTIPAVRVADMGQFWVIISNDNAPAVTSHPVQLTVGPRFGVAPNGSQLRLQMDCLNRQIPLTVQASSNLIHWFDLLTTNVNADTLEIVLPKTSAGNRFYRAFHTR